MKRSIRSQAVLSVGLLLPGAASLAAGGHFDVDDATVLDPGRCQYEAWIARAPAARHTGLHLGPACRVGPVELGLNIDLARTPAGGSGTLGPQLKFVAGPVVPKLGAAVVWGLGLDTRSSRTGHTGYAALTWFATDSLQLHANGGADWPATGTRMRRVGAAAEWAVNEQWSMLAERAKLLGAWTSRLGARFNVNEVISVDVSAARIGPQGSRSHVIGLNHEFGR